MKPVAFDYARPDDLDEAVALLGQDDAFVKVLAGGQSLGPMLNLRLVQPDLLVDLRRLAALREVAETPDGVTIGAAITHAAIEDGDVPDVAQGMLRHVAGGIAYRAVRNRGTIGGSLAHADPAADWVGCLAALGATVTVYGPAGRRSLAVDEFLTGTFETALDEDEVLESVTVPRLSAAARWGYYKFCRKAGEFAEVLAAVVHDPERGVVRAALGGKDSPSLVVADAAAVFDGADGIAAAVEGAAPGASADQKHLYRVALARAVAS